MNRRAWLGLGGSIFALYAVFLFATLGDYGATWDEPKWFDFGDYQWQLLTDSDPELPTPAAHERFRERENMRHYGSISSLAATASHRLLYGRLRWLGPDEARHVANLLFALATAAGIVLWGLRAIGPRGAALALLFWTLQPRLWPHAHNNMLDVPSAAGCLATAWCAWRIATLDRVRLGAWALFGAAAGVSFCLRAPNVYFQLLAIGLWGAGAQLAARRLWPGFSWLGALLAAGSFFACVKALSPVLWDTSIFLHVLRDNPRAYLDAAIGHVPILFRGETYARGDAPLGYAPWMWLVATPLVVVAATLVGVLRVVRVREAASAPALWLVLGAMALGKHLSGNGNYDGIRHFIEGLPPLALLAAWGADGLFARARSWPALARAGGGAALALGVAAPLSTGARIHPYQTAWFGPLAGGSARAWTSYDVDYWGQSLLPAADWIRQNVPSGRPVLAPVGTELLRHHLRGEYPVKLLRPERIAGPQPPPVVMLNRMGIIQPYSAVRNRLACPPRFDAVHREGPAGFPPTLLICRSARR